MLVSYYGQTLGAVTNYIDNGRILTLEELLSNYPASQNYVGLYVRVSNLYGSVDEILRCRYDGFFYRWVPQRENFSGTTATNQGTVSIVPLVTPPTLRMTASLLAANVNVVPSSVNAYIGQRARVIAPSSLPVSTYIIQITGLIGSNLNLLAGKTADLEYGSTGWFQSS